MDAREWDRRYAESELVWSAEPNQFVEACLADLPPGRAVDVAAGEGRNALWLAGRGWHVTAVDFSGAGLEKGRVLLAAHEAADALAVDWVCADVLAYDPADTTFDLALLVYLQLPPAQRREAVRRAFGWLRVGGTLFVVAHDSTNLTEGTGGPQDPAVLFTAADILDDLAGERFDTVRAERVARDVAEGRGTAHRHAGSGVAYDALVQLVKKAG